MEEADYFKIRALRWASSPARVLRAWPSRDMTNWDKPGVKWPYRCNCSSSKRRHQKWNQSWSCHITVHRLKLLSNISVTKSFLYISLHRLILTSPLHRTSVHPWGLRVHWKGSPKCQLSSLNLWMPVLLSPQPMFRPLFAKRLFDRSTVPYIGGY